MIEGAKKVHDFLTVGAAAPLQEAAVVGLNFPQSYYDGLTELYTRKRQVFLDGLDRIGLKHTVPQGSYFVMVDISDFQKPGMRFHGKSDMEFCEWMIRTIGVAAVPGSSFFREPVNHLIRLHFARSEETLNEALERLAKLPKLVEYVSHGRRHPAALLFRSRRIQAFSRALRESRRAFRPRRRPHRDGKGASRAQGGA